MRCAARFFRAARRPIMVGLLLGMTALAFGQVSPVEVLNPKLKADEAQYLPQLQSLQQSIAATKFPLPFRLARYPNARPGQRAASDPNGIEFVYFEGREVLKISGTYKAAFNARLLSKNERASRTFQDVVVPILRLVRQQIPANIDCDGIGFEIVYNARDANNAYDYEGQESLTVVFDRKDAFAYANASGNAERQQILNRSDIFVDGKDFGLALGQRAPFNVQALERSVPRQERESSSSLPASIAPTPAVSVAPSKPASKSRPTPANAIRLQAQFQAQLDAMVQEDGAKFHLATSAPPSFEVYGDRTVLHLTMRNTLSFNKSTSSIYKRAAQSFDLFLAPQLKGLLRKLPANANYDALDFSVLNRLGAEKTPSETIDYISPLISIRSFVEDKITGQDLIDHSIVLVNGVRIALNLQLVE
ncbi:MAG: hypothetical protein ACYDC6_08325 [Acidobacteriaceae bacterium]